MFKTDVIFTGYYGHKNTGDDAFVEIAEWGARKYWKKSNNRFLAIGKNLPQTLNPVKGYPFTIPRTYRLQNQLLISNTDYLISAGGSTMHRAMKNYNPKSIATERKKNGAKIKLGAIGVSIGPFKSKRDEYDISEYLKRLDFLAVRDQASYDYANSLNLPYSPVNAFDLAGLLPEIYNVNQKTNSEEKIIGISVCPYESVINGNIQQENRRNTMVVDLLKNIDVKEKLKFRFFVINGHERIGDYNLTKKTIEQVNPRSYEMIDYSPKTQQIYNSITECDFMISTRLHGAIFACFANVPFVLNEYHKKCADFLETIGYDENMRFYNSKYDIIEKSNQIINVIHNKNQYQFPTQLNSLKNKSSYNFTKTILA